MIKYNLKCKTCLKTFDSWFGSSKEYERIKKLNLLGCKYCSSSKVQKSLMAPSLNNTKKNSIRDNNIKLKKIKNTIKNYQKFIKENFHYVGGNFAYEARSLHYNKNSKKKGIYGKASLRDVKELKEEGIVTELIPWMNDKEN